MTVAQCGYLIKFNLTLALEFYICIHLFKYLRRNEFSCVTFVTYIVS